MSKKVDLPAPLGPMRARISPRSRANDTPSTSRTPPNARRTFSTSRTGARSATLARPQHAEDPARKHKHQGHEDDAEHELPVFRVTRHHGVEQLVERGAERRARQRVHAPQQHHHERLHRDRHRQRLGEHAALEEHEGAAREPAEEAGDDSRTQKKPMTTAASAAVTGAAASATSIGAFAHRTTSAAPYAPRPKAAAWPNETMPPVPIRRWRLAAKSANARISTSTQT